MRSNLVLEEFRVSRLALIQEAICCSWDRLDWKSGGRKGGRSVCHLHKDDDSRNETRVL